MIQSVRSRHEFAALADSGRRVRSGPITLTFLPGAPGDSPRLAFAIGRTVGGAVVRNRLRRRMRVLVRELGAQIPPGAYLMAAAPRAALLSFGELRGAVTEAFEQLERTVHR